MNVFSIIWLVGIIPIIVIFAIGVYWYESYNNMYPNREETALVSVMIGLFWPIAVPLVLGALIICLIVDGISSIVNYTHLKDGCFLLHRQCLHNDFSQCRGIVSTGFNFRSSCGIKLV